MSCKVIDDEASFLRDCLAHLEKCEALRTRAFLSGFQVPKFIERGCSKPPHSDGSFFLSNPSSHPDLFRGVLSNCTATDISRMTKVAQ
jgi:hypothetical protein